MGLSRTVSEINGDFSRKISHTRVFCTPADGVPLEVSAWGQKKTGMMGLPGGGESFKIDLAV